MSDPELVSETGVPVLGILAYVPAHGHSVAMIMLHQELGEWETTGVVIYAFGIRSGAMEPLPDDFELSDAMRAVLPA